MRFVLIAEINKLERPKTNLKLSSNVIIAGKLLVLKIVLMLKYTDEEIQKILKRQRFIETLADIDYQCYVEKIKRSQFYEKWVWKYLIDRGIIKPKDL